MGAVACKSSLHVGSLAPIHGEVFPPSCKPVKCLLDTRDLASFPLTASTPDINEAILLLTKLSSLYATASREQGLVEWHRGYPHCYETARRMGLPLFMLCVGAPGPSTARQYGQRVLSHPLIVDAIMSYFYPVMIATNGVPVCPFGTSAKLQPDPQLIEDLRILRSFNEKTQGNPVIRVIQPIVEPHVATGGGVEINMTPLSQRSSDINMTPLSQRTRGSSDITPRITRTSTMNIVDDGDHSTTRTSTMNIHDKHDKENEPHDEEKNIPVMCRIIETIRHHSVSCVGPSSVNVSNSNLAQPLLNTSSSSPPMPSSTLSMPSSLLNNAPSFAIEHGITLCPRLAGNYTLAGLVTHVCTSLKLTRHKSALKSIPAYIDLLVAESEAATTYGHIEKITLGMNDPHMGEVMLGGVCGILSVAAGTCRSFHVVDVDFDPTVISACELVEYARKHDICDVVLSRHPFQQSRISEKIPTQQIMQCTTNTKISSTCLERLRSSLYRYIPMTPAQACRVNSALATEDVSPLFFLSPSQIALYTIITYDHERHTKSIRYRDCVGKDVVDEWMKVVAHAPTSPITMVPKSHH